MNKDNALRLLDSGAVIREIEIGRYSMYCRDGAYIIHDNWQKRAVKRVVFTGNDEAEAVSKLLELGGRAQ
jgi:hypothetical protein